MTVLILFVAFTALLGAAAAAGWSYDSRDPEYGLGRIIDAHRHRRDAGTLWPTRPS